MANDNERACRYLRAATAMRHADPSAWTNLAIAYGRLGRSVDAARAYRRAIEANLGRRRPGTQGVSGEP